MTAPARSAPELDPAAGWLGPDSAEVRDFFADAPWCARVVEAVRRAAVKASSAADADGESLITLLDVSGEANKINSILHSNVIREIVRAGAAGYAGQMVCPGKRSAAPDLALTRPGSAAPDLAGEVKTATKTAAGFSANDVYDHAGDGGKRLLIGVDFVKDARGDEARPAPDPRRRLRPWMIRLGWVGAEDYAGWSISKMNQLPYQHMIPLWLAPAAELPACLLRGLGDKTMLKLGLEPTAPVSALARGTFGLPATGPIRYADVLGGLTNVYLPAALAAAADYERELIPLG